MGATIKDFLPNMGSGANINIGRYNSAFRNFSERRKSDIWNSIVLNGNGFIDGDIKNNLGVVGDYAKIYGGKDFFVGDCLLKEQSDRALPPPAEVQTVPLQALFVEVSYAGVLKIRKDVSSGTIIPVEDLSFEKDVRYFWIGLDPDYTLAEMPSLQWAVPGSELHLVIQDDEFYPGHPTTLPAHATIGSDKIYYDCKDASGMGTVFVSPEVNSSNTSEITESCPEWVYNRLSYCILLGVFNFQSPAHLVSDIDYVWGNGDKIFIPHVSRIAQGHFSEEEDNPNRTKIEIRNDIEAKSSNHYNSNFSGNGIVSDRLKSSSDGFSPKLGHLEYTSDSGLGVDSGINGSEVVDVVKKDGTGLGAIRAEKTIIGEIISSNNFPSPSEESVPGVSSNEGNVVKLVNADGTHTTKIEEGDSLVGKTILSGIIQTDTILLSKNNDKLRIAYQDAAGNIHEDGNVGVTINEDKIKTKEIIFKKDTETTYAENAVAIKSVMGDVESPDEETNETALYSPMYDINADDKQIYNWAPCGPGTTLAGKTEYSNVKVKDAYIDTSVDEPESGPGEKSGESYRAWRDRKVTGSSENWSVTEYYDFSIYDYRHPDKTTILVETALGADGEPILSSDGKKCKLKGVLTATTLTTDEFDEQHVQEWEDADTNYVELSTGVLKVTFKNGWSQIVYHPHVTFTRRPTIPSVNANMGNLRVGTLTVEGATYSSNNSDVVVPASIVLSKSSLSGTEDVSTAVRIGDADRIRLGANAGVASYVDMSNASANKRIQLMTGEDSSFMRIGEQENSCPDVLETGYSKVNGDAVGHIKVKTKDKNQVFIAGTDTSVGGCIYTFDQTGTTPKTKIEGGKITCDEFHVGQNVTMTSAEGFKTNTITPASGTTVTSTASTFVTNSIVSNSKSGFKNGFGTISISYKRALGKWSLAYGSSSSPSDISYIYHDEEPATFAGYLVNNYKGWMFVLSRVSADPVSSEGHDVYESKIVYLDLNSDSTQMTARLGEVSNNADYVIGFGVFVGYHF